MNSDRVDDFNVQCKAFLMAIPKPERDELINSMKSKKGNKNWLLENAKGLPSFMIAYFALLYGRHRVYNAIAPSVGLA